MRRGRSGGYHSGMVVGLGIDLVELPRVARALERWGERLVGKLMDQGEADRLPRSREERTVALALAIAGKEATSKALGTGWSWGVRWRDVVVELGPSPAVRLPARTAAAARRLGSDGRTRATLEVRGPLPLGQVWLLA